MQDRDKVAQRRPISRAGWKMVAKRVLREIRVDHVPLLSAGVAFYAFVSLFPALIAALAIYGLVADPTQVREQVTSYASALPGSPDEPSTALGIVTSGLEAAAAVAGDALTFTFAVTIVGALWTASSGVAGLVEGINAAYDVVDDRPFAKRRARAFALTFGAVLFVTLAVGLIAVAPAVMQAVGLGGVGRLLVNLARWPALALSIMVALAVLYRYGPDRDRPKTRWRSPGAFLATGLFLLVSGIFSLYVSSVGSFDATYGALAGVIVLLFWLYLSALAVLLGAELNHEVERQRLLEASEVAGSRTIGQPDPFMTQA